MVDLELVFTFFVQLLLMFAIIIYIILYDKYKRTPNYIKSNKYDYDLRTKRLEQNHKLKMQKSKNKKEA